jgi:hypothetical protein
LPSRCKKKGGLTSNLFGAPYSDPWVKYLFTDFLETNPETKINDLYKDKNLLERGANWVQDKKQDVFKWAMQMYKNTRNRKGLGLHQVQKCL